MHEYAALTLLDQEREDERWRAIFEIEQQRADYRAGLIASMILNVNRGKETDKVFSPADFFPALALGEVRADADGEMDTAQTVRYLRDGFSLYVA